MTGRAAGVPGDAAARTFTLAWCRTLAYISLSSQYAPATVLDSRTRIIVFGPQTAYLASITSVLILRRRPIQFPRNALQIGSAFNLKRS
jgi:hypothetical protein